MRFAILFKTEKLDFPVWVFRGPPCPCVLLLGRRRSKKHMPDELSNWLYLSLRRYYTDSRLVDEVGAKKYDTKPTILIDVKWALFYLSAIHNDNCSFFPVQSIEKSKVHLFFILSSSFWPFVVHTRAGCLVRVGLALAFRAFVPLFPRSFSGLFGLVDERMDGWMDRSIRWFVSSSVPSNVRSVCWFCKGIVLCVQTRFKRPFQWEVSEYY